jgi:hypothetical protein
MRLRHLHRIEQQSGEEKGHAPGNERCEALAAASVCGLFRSANRPLVEATGILIDCATTMQAILTRGAVSPLRFAR